jgi:Zn-finger nucleic acid-binding protein
MNCPVCATIELKMADRQGVEIDYCPQCRGIWLDRGELDKIIERSAALPPAAPPSERYFGDHHREDHDGHHDRDHDDYRHGQKYGKRRGFLGDIFDF